MSKGSILVTGAGGFVCSEIALALARSGGDVFAFDQHFDAETRQRLNAVRMISGDLRLGLPKDLGEVSAVIHGAAITAFPERLGITNADHIRRNMDMLTATLEFARSSGAGQFLFLSSMGVFQPDDGPHDGRFTEETQPTATCTYCAAKRAGELLTSSASEPGFKTLSLRLGNIFGPHETVRETRQKLCLVSRMIEEASADRVITVQGPKACREWSWLPDLAAAIAGLIENLPNSGPSVLHAGSPPVLDDLALARLVATRFAGTTIRLANPPHAQIRPPMASLRSSVLGDVAWTDMETALDQLIPAEVAI